MTRPSKKSLILDLLDQGYSNAEVAGLAGVSPDYVRACRQRRDGPSAADRKYGSRPEVKEKLREYKRAYQQRPEVKEKLREYKRAYQQRPEVKERKRDWMRARRAAVRLVAAAEHGQPAPAGLSTFEGGQPAPAGARNACRRGPNS